MHSEHLDSRGSSALICSHRGGAHGILILAFEISAKCSDQMVPSGRSRPILCGCLLARTDGVPSPHVGAKACVPNVCQLGKPRPNSSTLSRNKDRSKTLIQRTLREQSRPRITSAKEGKNGFVISRSPVRSRRVAPEFLSFGWLRSTWNSG